ncbi:MAG: beta-1,6-glucan synthase [Zoogloeaceae bacterium]|jgi:glucan 1,3-beta-glucosidase|nr:beta-1,6-glucan synthase [Zoogloeaceae bacterium]
MKTDFSHISPRFRRFYRIFLCLHLLALLALWGGTALETRPVALADLRLAEGEKLDCVSYAPYHLPGQTPLNPEIRISREQMAADLATLSSLARCVRTYAVNQGLEEVPELARSLGMRVWLGAWIGHDTALNRRELETAIRLANRYPGTVRGLIVGNEVMLRREQPEAALKSLLDEARRQTRVPVSYADVWEFWLRYPDLAQSVDFLTIHVLPYWEDHPVGVEQAVAHVAQARQRVLARYGKPVLIGETGWPSAGRQREAARPGKVEQARYLRDFAQVAHAQGWRYNLMEAIDQPWKRYLEGTVGGHWGILDAQLTPKFAFQGQVAQRASFMPVLLSSAAGMALALSLSLFGRRNLKKSLCAAVAGAWLGGVLRMAWEHGVVAYRDIREWELLGLVALLGALLTLGHALGRRARMPFLTAWQRYRHGALWRMPALRLAIFFAGALAALLLFADPRYRDFPYWLHVIPVPTLLALTISRLSRNGQEEGILAAVILFCGLGRWLMEPQNAQAQAWGMLCLLLASSGLLGWGGRARSSKANNAAKAEASKQ